MGARCSGFVEICPFQSSPPADPAIEPGDAGAGFWLWQVKSMEEAIEWVKRCPNPMNDDSVIEIRPVFDLEDFGPALTPELRAQEERLRALSDRRLAAGRK
jgi:hypothetical protein